MDEGGVDVEHVLSEEEDNVEEQQGEEDLNGDISDDPSDVPRLLQTPPNSTSDVSDNVVDDSGYERLATEGLATYADVSSTTNSVESPTDASHCLAHGKGEDSDTQSSTSSSPSVVTIDKSLGRSIAVGSDPVRDNMDDCLYGTCESSVSSTSTDAVTEWPIQDTRTKVIPDSPCLCMYCLYVRDCASRCTGQATLMFFCFCFFRAEF